MAVLFEKGAIAFGKEFMSGNGLKLTGKLFGTPDVYRLMFDRKARETVQKWVDLPWRIPFEENAPVRRFSDERSLADYVMRQLGISKDQALENGLTEVFDSIKTFKEQSERYLEGLVNEESNFQTVIAMSHLQGFAPSLNLLVKNFISFCEILDDPNKSSEDRVRKLNAIFHSVEDRATTLAGSHSPNKALVCLKVVAYLLAGLALLPLIPVLGMVAGGRIGALDGQENGQNIVVTAGKAVAGGLIGGLMGTAGALVGLCAVLISPKYLYDHQVQGQKHVKALATAFLPVAQRLFLFGKTIAENAKVSLDEADQTRSVLRSPRRQSA